MKKKIASLMEWVRPVGIALGLWSGYGFGTNDAERFHIMMPIIVVIMAGSIAFEGLVLGEVASEKIGYKADRGYQIQSALANLAIAVAALIVCVLNWGKYADATIMTVLLLFLTFSGINHLRTAIQEGNLKPINLMRPILSFITLIVVLPPMIMALK